MNFAGHASSTICCWFHDSRFLNALFPSTRLRSALLLETPASIGASHSSAEASNASSLKSGIVDAPSPSPSPSPFSL